MKLNSFQTKFEICKAHAMGITVISNYIYPEGKTTQERHVSFDFQDFKFDGFKSGAYSSKIRHFYT